MINTSTVSFLIRLFSCYSACFWKQSDQVCLSYGPLQNWELLFYYGFCPAVGSSNHLIVTKKTRPNKPQLRMVYGSLWLVFLAALIRVLFFCIRFVKLPKLLFVELWTFDMTLHDTGTGCFTGEFVGFPKNGSHFLTYPPVFMHVKSMTMSDHPTVGGFPIFGDPHRPGRSCTGRSTHTIGWWSTWICRMSRRRRERCGPAGHGLWVDLEASSIVSQC